LQIFFKVFFFNRISVQLSITNLDTGERHAVADMSTDPIADVVRSRRSIQRSTTLSVTGFMHFYPNYLCSDGSTTLTSTQAMSFAVNDEDAVTVSRLSFSESRVRNPSMFSRTARGFRTLFGSVVHKARVTVGEGMGVIA
jgi:hypothetical protein